MKIIIPKKHYVPSCADIDVYGVSKWLAPFDRNLFEKSKLFSISHFESNGWRALRAAGIENTQQIEENCRYECPYSRLRFWSLVPIVIMVRSFKPYLPDHVVNDETGITRRIWTNSNAVREWYKMFNDDKEYLPSPLRPDKIDLSMLGNGYTFGMMAHDGSSHLIDVCLHLDNGDQILCHSWEWCNK